MIVELIRHTTWPEDLVGEAAAICTGSENKDKARRGAMGSGHMSVAEHAVFTFRIEGVSRVLLAQLTRHRLASYSVESQRYCGADPTNIVIPDSMKIPELAEEAIEILEKISRLYEKALSVGVPDEDARYFTLQGGKTRLIMTMNARELLHFFSLRCCNRAQWEIRELADKMLELCMVVAPELFKNAGPGCMRGNCPEGKRGCGRPRNNG